MLDEEKRILKALGNLYTIIEFNKVDMLSADCGLYVDDVGKFCAMGAIMPDGMLEFARKQEIMSADSDINSIVYLYNKTLVSTETYCIDLFGITIHEAYEIQSNFDQTCVGENRLLYVEELIEEYEEKLDAFYVSN